MIEPNFSVIPAYAGFFLLGFHDIRRQVRKIPILAWRISTATEDYHNNSASPIVAAPDWVRLNQAIQYPDGSVFDISGKCIFGQLSDWADAQLVSVKFKIDGGALIPGEVRYKFYQKMCEWNKGQDCSSRRFILKKEPGEKLARLKEANGEPDFLTFLSLTESKNGEQLLVKLTTSVGEDQSTHKL